MKIGILGGGQLGQMLVQAGAALGMQFRALDTTADAPCARVCELVVGSFEDSLVLEEFLTGLDVATYEWENIPLATARAGAARVPDFYPPVAALEVVQDRLAQKNFLKKLGIATAPFVAVGSEAELAAAVQALGLPAVLKTRRMGYDGKGQLVLKNPAEVAGAWERLGEVPLILEGFIPFERELSIVAARGRTGETAFYRVAANEHRDGILRVSVVPAPGLTPAQQAQAELAAGQIMQAFSYVGVLTVEFFQYGKVLLVNEVATRVHNSGHWTMDGAETSQFTNHLLAIAGKPLGGTTLRDHTVMVNLIGTMPDATRVAAVRGARLYDYGKAPRAGRKLGHINAPLAALPELLALVSSTAPS